MSRRLSLKVGQRNALVLARIQALKADHPFWGYRRIWAQLRFAEGLAVNKKRILRLMREHGLLVRGNPRLKATRTPTRSKPRPPAPNQWWGIDMTKGDGRAHRLDVCRHRAGLVHEKDRRPLRGPPGKNGAVAGRAGLGRAAPVPPWKPGPRAAPDE